MTTRYCVASDGPHRYLIPVERVPDWVAFVAGEFVEGSDFNLGIEPNYAKRIDGGTLTFTDPKIERV